jgi:SAM-dependent methyltransferase
MPTAAIDLGTGGGHAAYRLARHAAKVTACDISADMLSAVAATARERGLTNIATVKAAVDAVPRPEEAFDFLSCRYSAHHWRRFEPGLAEARRILKKGSAAVFIDAYAPDDDLFDTHLQAVELLRDTSHVRNHSLAGWHAALARTGFRVKATRTWRLRMDFPVWIARMETPAPLAAAIRLLQEGASAEVKEYFAIEPDGSFLLDTMLIEAIAA